MNHAVNLFLALFLALATSACSSSGGGGTGGSVAGGASGSGAGGTAGGSGTCNGTTLFASEANDYSFSSTVTLPPQKVAPSTNLTFDWGDVTIDFTRHTVDPKTDINMVAVIAWDISLAETEKVLNADTIPGRDMNGVPLSYPTDGSTTSAKLFDFTLSGNPVDSSTILSFFDPSLHPPESNCYTVVASSGITVGSNARQVQSFVLDTTSTNTTVKLTNDSMGLSFKADMQSLTPTFIPAHQAAITLDWSNMQKNALGNTFILNKIQKVLLGHYTQTPAELGGTDQFLNLETIATALYRGNIASGTTVDFSSLKDTSGNSFSGIDNTGTWLIALQCGDCRNPAPWYLAILKPCT